MKKNIAIALLGLFLLSFTACSDADVKADLKLIKEDLAKTKEDLAKLKADHERLLKDEIKVEKQERKDIDEKMDGAELN
ncbi:MAG: hypothetical protein JWM14_2341 [Chitinophagaceae bacterium]|nr:hypothetical protein [Chitinophagaceae bacterium]